MIKAYETNNLFSNRGRGLENLALGAYELDLRFLQARDKKSPSLAGRAVHINRQIGRGRRPEHHICTLRSFGGVSNRCLLNQGLLIPAGS